MAQLITLSFISMRVRAVQLLPLVVQALVLVPLG
jgi:hypothetical protein